MKSSRWLLPPAVLLLAGLGVSLYLLFRTYGLLYGEAVAGGDFCSAVLDVSCDETLQSTSSWLLGIPIAGWGVVYFGGLLVLLTLAWLIEDLFRPQAIAGAVAANVAGLGFSVYLLIMIATKQAPLCPMCLVVHSLNLLLFPALLFAAGESPRALAGRIQSGFAMVFDGGSGGKNSGRVWSAVAFLACALAGAAIYEGVFILTQHRAASSGDIESLGRTLSALRERERVRIPVRPDDPRVGSVTAPVQMVVFSDLECPACRRLRPILESLPEKYPDEVSIVFKHFPGNADCNPGTEKYLHEGACRAAWLAEAARLQGHFWETHDAIYDAGAAPPEDGLEVWAGALPVDTEKLLSDFTSDAVGARVYEDASLGVELGVKGTPTVFINGRRIKDVNKLEDELLAELFLVAEARID